ncbi:hypothetical protein R9D86_000444 [Escherichia coli]|uniref:Deoxynucleotide monophosphate kinase n=1 Tax=Shigella phage Silverhawkium TaxID=2530185 RepID=A0A482JL79_9CAUD|nr:hypothetical protein [Escherichia coli]QBP33119.1 deoxynucleotide monophosphate kinase [Shigella phage Silverhawkium]
MKDIIAFTGKARSGKDTSCTIVKNILIDEGYAVKVFAFADNLKATAGTIFDLNWQDLYGETKEMPQKFNLDFDNIESRVTWAFQRHMKGKKIHEDSKLCGEIADKLIKELKKVGKPTIKTRLGLRNDYYISSRQIQQVWGSEVVRKTLGERFWIVDLAERMEKFYGECDKAGHTPVMLICDLRFDIEAEFLQSYDSQIIEVKRSNATQVASHSSEKGISTNFGRDIIQNNGTLDELKGKLTAIIGL